ncbi:choline ABC transporter substrate-binding protein [Kushneria phosphatilytica]|nr:glycine/betaine ABC transporter substrate-binding protein [Kushneria phosphatilytica]
MALISVTGMSANVMADVPESCQTVRFAEVGWTDITATTALARTVFAGLGYDTRSDTVSVPVAYSGLKTGDLDVFLGNWMPSMASISDPYIDKGQVDRLTANLKGAKYTLAVPQYVIDAGITSVADLDKHRDRFDGKIYGIEAGNDGNQIIQEMIDQNFDGLGDWNLVASSEAGMLSQVKTATRNKEWIVFLGWAPHPMNTRFDMGYLSGADDYFGPNYGGATVYTNTRGGYVNECSNAGKLLKQMTFTLPMENELMGDIMDEGRKPMAAARAWLNAHPDTLEGWLKGVTTVEGQPGLQAVRASLQ